MHQGTRRPLDPEARLEYVPRTAQVTRLLKPRAVAIIGISPEPGLASVTAPCRSHPMTSVVYEFPRAEGDPYYPVPRPENTATYRKYKELADETPDTFFAGRLFEGDVATVLRDSRMDDDEVFVEERGACESPSSKVGAEVFDEVDRPDKLAGGGIEAVEVSDGAQRAYAPRDLPPQTPARRMAGPLS